MSKANTDLWALVSVGLVSWFLLELFLAAKTGEYWTGRLILSVILASCARIYYRFLRDTKTPDTH